MIGAIYAIVHVESGRPYIGSAANVRGRHVRHLNDLRRGIHHSVKLQRAWNKYGAEAFEFCLLEDVAHKEDLIKREQVWLDALRPWESGFNHLPNAGSILGTHRTPETKARLSAAHTGRKRQPVTAETRAKLSASAKKRGINPEIQRRGALATSKKIYSVEERLRLSIAMRGRKMPPRTDQWRLRQSQAKKGRVFRKASIE